MDSFVKVLQWITKESLLNKNPLSPVLLLLSYRLSETFEDKESFLSTFMNVCSKALNPPIQKLDWIWFNNYIADSSVGLFLFRFFVDLCGSALFREKK